MAKYFPNMGEFIDLKFYISELRTGKCTVVNTSIICAQTENYTAKHVFERRNTTIVYKAKPVGVNVSLRIMSTPFQQLEQGPAISKIVINIFYF